MKKTLLLVLSAFGLALNLLNAQIIITDAVFPAVGDTLRYAIDNAPPASVNPATPPGGNQLWDFSGLNAGQNTTLVFQSPGGGQNAANFPGADLAVFGTGRETYYNVTNSAFQVLGYAGIDPLNLGLNSIFPYAPALTERRAPVQFFDINSVVSYLGVAFSTDAPPLDSLFGNQPVNIDSMRLRIATDRTDVVDAWGTCQIPGGSFPVLRQKRTEYQTTSIDVYVNLGFFGQWVDLSTLIGGGSGLGSLIGTDTILSYRFLSDTEKEEIAIAEMNADQATVRSVQFKAVSTVSSWEPALEDAPGKLTLRASPSPAANWVRLDGAHLPEDSYTLQLLNAQGRRVWERKYDLSGYCSIPISIEDFSQGVYFYRLLDSGGRMVSVNRFVVTRP